MAERSASRLLAISHAAYALLLRACPAGYRRTFGPLMWQAFRDLAREAYARHGAWGVVALWARILPDACHTALAEHIVALKERRAIAQVELAAAGAQGECAMRPIVSRSLAAAISAAALLIGVLSVWPLYIQALLALVWHLVGGIAAGPLSGALIIPVGMWGFLVSILLSDLGRYLALSGVGILLTLAALLFGPRRRLLLAAQALTLVGILAFPWFFRYQAPVVAAPGVDLQVATQPGLLDGVVKQAQAFSEIVPSTYEILGWSGDGVLYYRETVKAMQTTRTWAYMPGRGAHPQLVAEPVDVGPITAVKREALLERVRVQVWPANAEVSTRSLKIRQDGVASPDGRWAAAVAKHTYGPEDVIVVGLE